MHWSNEYYNRDELFHDACHKGDYKLVKSYLKEGIDPHL